MPKIALYIIEGTQKSMVPTAKACSSINPPSIFPKVTKPLKKSIKMAPIHTVAMPQANLFCAVRFRIFGLFCTAGIGEITMMIFRGGEEI